MYRIIPGQKNNGEKPDMKINLKKTLSLILALVLCFSILPVQALAEDELPPAVEEQTENTAEIPADEENGEGEATEPAEDPLPEDVPMPSEEQETVTPEPDGEEVPQEPVPAEPEEDEDTVTEVPADDPLQDPPPTEEEETPSEPQQPEPQVIPPEEETTEPEAPMQEEAEEETEHVRIDVEPEIFEASPDPSAPTEGSFESYANKVLYGEKRRSASPSSSAGASLTGFDSVIYNALLGRIAEVAAGRKTSTLFYLSFADLGITKSYWTAEELGVPYVLDDDWNMPADAVAALTSMFDMDICSIYYALLFDCPYELYWFDKVSQYYAEGYRYGVYWEEEVGDYVMYVEGGYTFHFAVVEEYRATSTSVYETNPSAGTAVQNARNRALSIVSDNAYLSNANKLFAYKETIAALSDYNYEAAYEGYTYDYGNPWQLIWVFDGDPDTKVVCEGFSKAFQYLCELSTFTGPVSCISVDGGMDGFPHMWNVVTMEDGKNYLCDVTNCEIENDGPVGELFLQGYTSGNVYDGYSFNWCDYEYSSTCFDLFPVERLTLSATDYTPPVSGQVSINKTGLDLYVNETYTLQLRDEAGTWVRGIWESSRPEIASVSAEGKVKALKSGTTVISAKDSDGNLYGTCAVRVLFTDVADPSRYFYGPVYWALENNITTGAGGAGKFSPNDNCTREQIVTFLWRLMGEQEPTTFTSFTDVPENAWYYKPICWAAEKGITVGLNDGTGRFGVGQACTRAMCVTFLWRAAGKPAPATQGNFTDMRPGAYYVDAVSWAAEKNITVGLNDGTGRFGVDNTCTRAMIVTFLYRYAHMS